MTADTFGDYILSADVIVQEHAQCRHGVVAPPHDDCGAREYDNQEGDERASAGEVPAPDEMGTDTLRGVGTCEDIIDE